MKESSILSSVLSLTLLVLSGCATPSTQVSNTKANIDASVKGVVEAENFGFKTKATFSDIASASTVSIKKNYNSDQPYASIASAISDKNGAFIIPASKINNLNIGDIYLLEANKRTELGKPVLTVLSAIQWTIKGWVSVSNKGISISSKTSALVMAHLLSPDKIKAEEIIGAVDSSGTESKIIKEIGNHSTDLLTQLANYYKQEILEDLDPLQDTTIENDTCYSSKSSDRKIGDCSNNDLAGNIGEDPTLEPGIDLPIPELPVIINSAPEIKAFDLIPEKSSAKMNEQVKVNYNIDATDKDNDNLSFSILKNGQLFASGKNGSFYVTAGNNDTYTAVVKDLESSVTKDNTTNILLKQDIAPVINSFVIKAPSIANPNETVNATFTSSVTGSSNLSYSLTDNGQYITNQANGSIRVGTGPHNYRLTVKDSDTGLESSQDLVVNVGINAPPAVNNVTVYPTDITLSKGQTQAEVNLTATDITDPQGITATSWYLNGIEVLKTNTGKIYLTAGRYSIDFIATDSMGLSTKVNKIVNVNAAPVSSFTYSQDKLSTSNDKLIFGLSIVGNVGYFIIETKAGNFTLNGLAEIKVGGGQSYAVTKASTNLSTATSRREVPLDFSQTTESWSGGKQFFLRMPDGTVLGPITVYRN